jgi:hypothetical protein
MWQANLYNWQLSMMLLQRWSHRPVLQTLLRQTPGIYKLRQYQAHPSTAHLTHHQLQLQLKSLCPCPRQQQHQHCSQLQVQLHMQLLLQLL